MNKQDVLIGIDKLSQAQVDTTIEVMDSLVKDGIVQDGEQMGLILISTVVTTTRAFGTFMSSAEDPNIFLNQYVGSLLARVMLIKNHDLISDEDALSAISKAIADLPGAVARARLEDKKTLQ